MDCFVQCLFFLSNVAKTHIKTTCCAINGTKVCTNIFCDLGLVHLLLRRIAQLERMVKELYDKVCRLEEEKYDCEVKIGRQDYEVYHEPSATGHWTLHLTLPCL